MLRAGSTGVGVADGLRAAMISEGLSEEEARSRFCIVKPLNVNCFQWACGFWFGSSDAVSAVSRG